MASAASGGTLDVNGTATTTISGITTGPAPAPLGKAADFSSNHFYGMQGKTELNQTRGTDPASGQQGLQNSDSFAKLQPPTSQVPILGDIPVTGRAFAVDPAATAANGPDGGLALTQMLQGEYPRYPESRWGSREVTPTVTSAVPGPQGIPARSWTAVDHSARSDPRYCPNDPVALYKGPG